MTQEQKAKAYDEALEKAKSMIDDLRKGEDILAVSELETMFPELQESEDERIRKWLIGYFRQYKEDGIEKYANGLKVESIIAWLEKQGEKNPVNKVEPKFKLEHGKWYRCILTPVVHKHFTVGKVYKCELEGCLVDDINEDRIVDLDLECFRPATEDEIPQEKSKAELVDANETNSKHQDIMQMLQSIYEVLVSINNKNAPVQVIPYTPQPLTPFYDTSKPYCDTTNKIEDNERPETNM